MSPLTSVMEVKGLFDVLLFCARLFYIRAPCFFVDFYAKIKSNKPT